MFLTSQLKICGEVELRVHQYLLSRSGRIEDIEVAGIRREVLRFEYIPGGDVERALREGRLLPADELPVFLAGLLRGIQAGNRYTITLRGEAVADLVPAEHNKNADAVAAVGAAIN